MCELCGPPDEAERARKDLLAEAAQIERTAHRLATQLRNLARGRVKPHAGGWGVEVRRDSARLIRLTAPHL